MLRFSRIRRSLDSSWIRLCLVLWLASVSSLWMQMTFYYTVAGGETEGNTYFKIVGATWSFLESPLHCWIGDVNGLEDFVVEDAQLWPVFALSSTILVAGLLSRVANSPPLKGTPLGRHVVVQSSRRTFSRRILKSIGIHACLLILTTWMISREFFLLIPIGSHMSIDFYSGEADFRYSIGAIDCHPSVSQEGPADFEFECMFVRPRWEKREAGFWHLYFPLWLPLIAAALPTGIGLFLDRRRRIPPGHCPCCGYNLTGNTSGVCSECGTLLGVKGSHGCHGIEGVKSPSPVKIDRHGGESMPGV